MTDTDRSTQMGAPTYTYATGEPMSVGDTCLIGHRSGLWEIYQLGTFTNGRQYASLMLGKRRTASSLDELLCIPSGSHGGES